MFSWLKNKLINVALNTMSTEEKLCRMFLKTKPKHVRKVVIYTIADYFLKKFSQHFQNNASYKKKGIVINGTINNVNVSVVKGKMGAPNAAVLMEMFQRIGVESVFRIDVCGTISEGLPIGSLFVPKDAISGEGTSRCYADAHDMDIDFNEPFPSDQKFLQVAKQLAKEKFNLQMGTIWTTDGLFCETPKMTAKWAKMGAKAVDMETSTVYLLGNLFKIRTIAILAVVDRPNSEHDFIRSNKLHQNASQSMGNLFEFTINDLPQFLHTKKKM